jgi:hypothetical protein
MIMGERMDIEQVRVKVRDYQMVPVMAEFGKTTGKIHKFDRHPLAPGHLNVYLDRTIWISKDAYEILHNLMYLFLRKRIDQDVMRCYEGEFLRLLKEQGGKGNCGIGHRAGYIVIDGDPNFDIY